MPRFWVTRNKTKGSGWNPWCFSHIWADKPSRQQNGEWDGRSREWIFLDIAEILTGLSMIPTDKAIEIEVRVIGEEG